MPNDFWRTMNLKTFFILFFLPLSLFAGDFSAQGPIPLRSQHPVYLQTVQLSPTRAVPVPEGFLEWRLDSAYSNLYERGSNAATDIDLDMELYRMGIELAYGFAPSWEVGLEIPMLRFAGGFLDPFIQDFHNAFGFPNGGRNLVANNRFNYRIRSTGIDYNISEKEMTLSDILFSLKHQFIAEERLTPAVSWRFAFKLPTGNQGEGAGNFSPGLGFGIAMEKSHRRWHGYLNLNYLYNGKNTLLEPLLHSNFFDFAVVGEYSFSKRLSGLLQLSGGTPRLKGSGLDAWDGVPLDLVVGIGGDIPLASSSAYIWKVGFSEDVTAKGPSVDFTAFASFGIQFPLSRSRNLKGDFLGRVAN